MGGLGDIGPNRNAMQTNPTSQMNVEDTTRLINENDIRSRIRNIKRFLRMTEARLNRLQVGFFFYFNKYGPINTRNIKY
jgi:hypothetical protein